MRKNLFLQSFKYLEQQKEREISLERKEISLSKLPEEINSEGDEELEKISVEKKYKKNPYAIYLGKGLVFLNPDVAYQHLMQQPKKEMPVRYRNTLTKAFFNGTEIGQLNTLYKDWKKYKEEVLPKISEYFCYIKKNAEKCPLGKKYVTYIIANYTPTSEETFKEGAVDLWYFKFWVLFKFYVSMVKNN